MGRRRTCWLRRTVDAAPEHLEQIRGCHDAHKTTAIGDRQASDGPASHQVGGSSNGLCQRHRHSMRCHQVGDRSSRSNAGACTAPGISIGENANGFPCERHDHMVDPLAAHQLPRVGRRHRRGDRLHPLGHHVTQPHSRTSRRPPGFRRIAALSTRPRGSRNNSAGFFSMTAGHIERLQGTCLMAQAREPRETACPLKMLTLRRDRCSPRAAGATSRPCGIEER